MIVSFLLGLSIIIAPSNAIASNFVFGECSPGKDSCRDCYISLAQHLFQSDENVFNLSKAFFPPETNTPDFVVIQYHFQNATYSDTKTWFWGASASYFMYPIGTFQFLSLFFGKPSTFWEGQVHVTLNATECEGAKNEHLSFLTQRLRIYVEQYNIRPSIDDTYQAEAVDGVALNELYKERSNQLINIVICLQTLGIVMAFVGVVAIVCCTMKSTDGRKFCVREIRHRSTVSKETFLISLSINGMMFLLYAMAMDIAAVVYQFNKDDLLSDSKDELRGLYKRGLKFLSIMTLVFDLFAFILYIGAHCFAIVCYYHKNPDDKIYSIFTVIPSLLGPLLGLINHCPFIAIAYINDSYYSSSIFVYYMVVFFTCFIAVHLSMRAFLRTQLPEAQMESNVWSMFKLENKSVQCLCSTILSTVLLLFLLSVVVIVICYLIIIPLNGSLSGASHQLIGFYQTVIIFLGIFITYKTVLHKKHGSLKSAIGNRKKPLKETDNTDTQWSDLPQVEKAIVYHEMVLDLVKHLYDEKKLSDGKAGDDSDSTSKKSTMLDGSGSKHTDPARDDDSDERESLRSASVPLIDVVGTRT